MSRLRKIAVMKTRSQHAYEARLRRFLLMRAAAATGNDPRAAEGLALIQKHYATDWEPVLTAYENGLPFPKRRYQSAGARAAQERAEAAAFRPRSRHLSHPAYPSETVQGALEMQCHRDGCPEVMVNVRRQRRYCSDKCRKEAARARREAERAEFEAVTVECAVEGCQVRFFQLRPDHRFCSARCRSAGRVPRARVSHAPRPCEGCGEAFKPKTSRSRFCSARCRVRVWDRRQAELNGDTKPVPVIR